jgi:hypothetical protein
MLWTLGRVTVADMSIRDQITSLVVQEFRLHAADTSGAAARIVADFSDGLEAPVPLLTSIDDERDVATVRGLRAGESTDADPSERDKLGPLVASWRPLKHYAPRITERSKKGSSHYRLAVTESGINNAAPDPLPLGGADSYASGTASPVGLLWIGLPIATYAGLMVLLGREEDHDAGTADPKTWPLPLSSSLGVRIYESQS